MSNNQFEEKIEAIKTSIQKCADLCEQKRFEDALSECKNFIDKYPKVWQFYYFLSYALEARYDYKQAMVYAEKMLQIERTEPCLEIFARIAYKLGLLDLSTSICDEIVGINPNSKEAHFIKGCCKGKAQANVGPRVERIDGNAEKTEVVYTARGEQLIIERILDKIDPENKYVIDIGAADGVTFSNSYSLLLRGWDGLLIEPRRSGCESILNNLRNCSGNIRLINSFATPHLTEQLCDLFETPQNPGFVSIDIDSFDYEIALSVVKSMRPALICVEINERIPPPVKYIFHYDKGKTYQDMSMVAGASLQSFVDMFNRNGYYAVELEYNNLFVVSELFEAQMNMLGYIRRSAEWLWREKVVNREDFYSFFPWNKDYAHLRNLGGNAFVDEWMKIVGHRLENCRITLEG